MELSDNISIEYEKNNNQNLFNDFIDLTDIEKIQNFIPIYNRFFLLNKNNNDKINFKLFTKLINIKKREKNRYICDLEKNNKISSKEVFFKFSPLLDPLKYMTGKYSKYDEMLLNLPKYNKIDNDETQINCHSKTLDENNSAYVDGFFTYLTSNLCNKFNFLHGIDFYGFFLAIKNNFEIDIIDDVDYLCENDYFIENQNKLFHLEKTDYEMVFNNLGSRKIKDKLQFASLDDTVLDVIDINQLLLENNETNTVDDNDKCGNSDIKVDDADDTVDGAYDLDFFKIKKMSKNVSNSSNLSSDCSSRSSNTSNECEEPCSGESDDDYY